MPPLQPQPTGSQPADDGLDSFFGSYQKAQQQPDGLDDFFLSYQRANAPPTAGQVAGEAGRIAGQAATGAVRMGGLALSTIARAADAVAGVVGVHPNLEQKTFEGMDKILGPMHEMYDFKKGEEPSFAGKLAGGILSTPISMLDWPEGGIERYEEVKAHGGSEEEAIAAGLTRAEIGAASQLLPAEAGAGIAARMGGQLAGRVAGAVTGAGIGTLAGAAGRAIENVETPERMPELKQPVVPTAAQGALEAVPGAIFGILGAGHAEPHEPQVPETHEEPAPLAPREEHVEGAPAPEEAAPSGGEPRPPEERLTAQPVKSERQQELERLRELAAEPEMQSYLDKEIVKEQAATKKTFDAEQKAAAQQDQAAEARRLAGQTNDPDLSKQLLAQAEKLAPTQKPAAETPPPEGEPAVESEPAGAARETPQPSSPSTAPTTPEAAAAPPQHTAGTSPFFRAIRDELGGIHTSERDDAGFDKAAPVMLGGKTPDGKGRGPLFNGNGVSMDRFVEWLHGRGYLTDADIAHADEQTPGGSHQLGYDLLQREKANPGSVAPIRDQSARWQGVSDAQRQRELVDAADQRGIETQGRTLESIERDLWAAEDHEHAQQYGHGPEHMMTALAAHLDPDAVERLAVQHENDEPAFHQAIRELVDAHTEHADTSGLGRGLEPGPGGAPEEPAVRAEHPQAAAMETGQHPIRSEQGVGSARPVGRAEAGPAVPRAGPERGGAAGAEAGGTVARMDAARAYVAKAAKGIATPADAQAALQDHVANIKDWLTRQGLGWAHEGTEYRADPDLGNKAHVRLENGQWVVRVGHELLAEHPNVVAQTMLHEHAHIADWMGGLYSSHPDWQAAMRQLQDVHAAHGGDFSKFFEYPFGREYEGAEAMHADQEAMRSEAFAQAVVAHNTPLREVIEREAPEAAKFVAQALEHAKAEGVRPTTGPEGAKDFGRLSESFAAARSAERAAEPAAPGQLERTLFAKRPTVGYQHYQGVEKPEEESIGPRLKDALTKTFAPATRGGFAEETAGIMRANYGEQAREQAVAENQLKKTAQAFSQRPAEENMRFVDRMERGQPQQSAGLNSVARALRGLLDKKLAQVQALGTGALDHFIENYFPHMWVEKDQALRDIYGLRRPMQGGQAFRKQRTIPFTRDGLRWRAYDPDGAFLGSFDTEAQAKAATPAGGRTGQPLTPVTHNPVEMVLLKAREMDRYIYAQRIAGEMKNAGMALFVPHDQRGQAPAGWAPINDNVFRSGNGQYYAPSEAATLINNHLSPGLRGNAAFEAWRKAGNLLNQAQLGLSAYHLGFTTLDTITSKYALGLKQISRGDVFKGVGNVAKAVGGGVTLTQPIANFIKGDRLLRAYLGELHDPGLVPLVAALQDAGGRVRLDPFYSNEAIKTFNNAGAPGKVAHALPALAELFNKPLFEHIVPRQKLGVFFDMAKDWLETNPGASVQERRAGLGKLWDSVDNRMGQMVYDNLFWDRTLKDALLGSVRSVGWNVGTLRELGGGLFDVKDIMKGGGISDRTAYTLALPMVTAIGGAITQMLYGAAQGMSAQDSFPKELRDYFFPRTFKKRPDGSDDRVSLPGYMKDVAAYAHDPVQTLANKTHPLISMLAQDLTNKDFYGAAISDIGDPKFQRWLDRGLYPLRQSLPFSWQNYVQQARLQGKDPSATSIEDLRDWFTSPQQIGISPAPAYMTKSKEQEESAELQAAHEPLRQRYVQQLRTGEDRGKVIQSAQRAGFSKREIEQMLHQAQRTSGPRRLRAFGPEQQQ